MWSLRRKEIDWGLVEPYFQNEAIAEVGHSLTVYMLDGGLLPINNFDWSDPRGGGPLVGYNLSPWPSEADIAGRNEKGTPIRASPEILEHTDVYPVPIVYFERIQQNDFWDYHIGVFGVSAAKVGPLIQGRRYTNGTSLTDIDVDTNVSQIPVASNTKLGDRAALEVENRKRAMAETLSRCLIATIQAEKVQAKKQASIATSLLAGMLGSELDHEGQASSLTAKDGSNSDGSPSHDTDWEDSDEKDPDEPARFAEIVKFLTDPRIRRVLALETMIFVIAEHTLLSYINRLREIELTVDEFRDFLVFCNFKKFLFL
jgi:hypothetical protein